jgi:hydroxypyruvate isomerase
MSPISASVRPRRLYFQRAWAPVIRSRKSISPRQSVLLGFRTHGSRPVRRRLRSPWLRAFASGASSPVGVVCGAPADVRTPLWTCVGVGARKGLEAKLDVAIEAARQLGARQIVALTGIDPDSPRQSQIDRFVSNLAWAASRVGDEGLTLCLEPTNARTLPGMLLNHFEEGCEIARAVGRPSVRMIYDTAHVQSMDGDLLGNFERAFDLIEIVQIANHPGRTEPEIGEANLATVIEKVHACGYRGLVELEHVWSKGGLDAEQRGLDWLRRIDASLASKNCAISHRPCSN